MNKKLLVLIVSVMVILIAADIFILLYEKEQPEGKAPNFDEYIVSDSFTGEIATINYSSNDRAEEHKNQIEEEIEKGVNFSGRYIVVSWECGTNCETGVVIDASDGKIYDLPLDSSCGMDFRVNSKLLVINSDENCVKDLASDSVKTRQFIWEK